MAEAKSNRFIQYFPLLLEALRSVKPNPMRPAEAMAWIRSHKQVAEDDLTRQIANGSQTIFENDVHWSRFYLVKAGLIEKRKRGLWSLTPAGENTRLSQEESWSLYTRIRDAHRPGAPKDETEAPAPEISDENDADRSYWFVGASWDEGDQLSRFREEGIWENGYEDRFSDVVNRMKAGDRIAVKAGFVQKHGLPFDVGGQPVSVMRIKATGIVTKNHGNGRTVDVAWDPPSKPRDWYFYTYRLTIVEADIEADGARRLIEFTFRGASQDYSWFLAQPYWVEKYGKNSQIATDKPAASITNEIPDAFSEAEDESPYTVDDIIAEGCFLSQDRLNGILKQWRTKKNMILQGPPGTGKTWLAKRLGFALVGSNDRETARSRLRVVQFHPSLAYEDFVRGWRPTGAGGLALVDGVLMQAIDAAASEPDRPFVLVVEEINRGNPAQIFGEMLTLLEHTKRRPSEAIELAYRDPKKAGERVHVPSNLYVIGTMNVADRSLAIVDLALRRRFVFIDLEPEFGSSWRNWCTDRGLSAVTCSTIEKRINALNAEITKSVSLGAQFRIGHSYLTPDIDEKIRDGHSWFRGKVEAEIGPLLDEYWYDVPDLAKKAKATLLSGLD